MNRKDFLLRSAMMGAATMLPIQKLAFYFKHHLQLCAGALEHL